ncbi:MAG: tungsten ABC transporter substrate-binding protein [Deltaproteobacteria bacterium]|nr:MAG: tungsten ABC transporter substrate-binding protein [Deltaproteobacteria bacterium]
MRKTLLSLFMAAIFVAPSLSLADETRLRMSTTTSTENSGLLAELIPPFEEMEGVKVDVIAVGTGKALQLGRNGDVDVVFVHARPAEDKFVNEGYGTYRKDVMHNDFVIVGPNEDPAGLASAKDLVSVMSALSEGKATFVSRGDDSGTHKKEKLLWKAAGITPEGDWYAEAGQGMGAVLTIADEKRGYALSDRGTFIAYGGKVDLKVLFEGDQSLANPYGIIAVNPEKHPQAKFALAKAFIDYVIGEKGQKIIRDFRKNGQQLFYPDAIK